MVWLLIQSMESHSHKCWCKSLAFQLNLGNLRLPHISFLCYPQKHMVFLCISFWSHKELSWHYLWLFCLFCPRKTKLWIPSTPVSFLFYFSVCLQTSVYTQRILPPFPLITTALTYYCPPPWLPSLPIIVLFHFSDSLHSFKTFTFTDLGMSSFTSHDKNIFLWFQYLAHCPPHTTCSVNIIWKNEWILTCLFPKRTWL